MSSQNSSHSGSHHLRFYIVLITLIVGGIFFLLMMNDGENNFSLTSAIVGEFENGTFEEMMADGQPDEFGKFNQDIALQLSFDRIPTVEKEVRIKNIELLFGDTNTAININEDLLEVNNVEQVNLRMADFLGKLSFDKQGLSLDGKVKRLGVNDVAFSSKEEMKISFRDLNYNFLNLDNLELDEVKFSAGNGNLAVGEKLNYRLEDDIVTLYVFQGKLIIDKINATALFLEGTVKAVKAGGELNLDLR